MTDIQGREVEVESWLYIATSPGGLFLGQGVVWADDRYSAYDQVRTLYGVLATIRVERDETEVAT